MKGITGNPALDAYHRMAISPVGGARPVERPEASAATSTGSAAAQITISSQARDLAAESAAVDTKKVDALRQRIENGQYQIDAQMIASGMIDQL